MPELAGSRDDGTGTPAGAVRADGARLEVHDPSLLQGCTAERARAARAWGDGRRRHAPGQVGRAGAGGRPGDYRHPAADDRRLLAGRTRSTRPRPPDVPPGETPSDGLVLRHAAAGQDRLVPGRRGRGRGFARSHGPDALEIGRDELAGRLARTHRGIKPTLMDQKVLAGIGNIYADETLHRAGIHPERPAVDAHARGGRPAPSRRSARSWPRRSSWRARASTRAIGRSSAWRAGSWPRTPSMAARTSPAGRAKGRS